MLPNKYQKSKNYEKQNDECHGSCLERPQSNLRYKRYN